MNNDFSTVEQAAQALKNGEVILVIDDPDRENEGDLICAAEFATTENINFMAKYAKGLICTPMSSEYVQKLGLSQMVNVNTDNHCTAFTQSIDYISTTTGISAEERGLTARMCADDNAKPEDFRRPGHMFPLEAKAGGVLERNGHTEATVDMMKIAGLKPVGICCEIMREDGTMMRTSELLEFAKEFNLKIITIKDIQKYQKINFKFMKEVSHANLPTEYGDFEIHGFQNIINGEHHIALTMGDIADGKPVLCRMHSECLTGDVFASKKCDCGAQLHEAMTKISKQGRGVLLYLRQEGRGIGLINKIKAYALQQQGFDTVDANIKLGFDADLRDYSCAAQIFKHLGVNSVELMTNNPLKIDALKEYGIKVEKRVPIQIHSNKQNYFYLKTKQHRMGHLVDYDNENN